MEEAARDVAAKAAEIAAQAGLFWQAVAILVLGALVIVLMRRFGVPLWYYFRSIPPPPDPVKDPPAPPIPLHPDGTIHLDQKPEEPKP